MKFSDPSATPLRQSGSVRDGETLDQRGEWFAVVRAIGLILVAIFAASLLLH